MEKLTEYEYVKIESAVNGILAINGNITQYIMDSLYNSRGNLDENWQSVAGRLFIKKLESLCSAINDTNKAMYSMANSISAQSLEIYNEQK